MICFTSKRKSHQIKGKVDGPANCMLLNSNLYLTNHASRIFCLKQQPGAAGQNLLHSLGTSLYHVVWLMGYFTTGFRKLQKPTDSNQFIKLSTNRKSVLAAAARMLIYTSKGICLLLSYENKAHLFLQYNKHAHIFGRSNVKS